MTVKSNGNLNAGPSTKAYSIYNSGMISKYFIMHRVYV